MLWHLTSKFCVLSCKLVLAWEPWGNAGGTATGSPSWVRCPIRGKDFFSFCCGILSLLYFHCFNAYFFLPFIPFKENCIYTKWVPFCKKLLKQRLIDDCQRRYSNPSICSFTPRAPDLRMVPFWSVYCYWFVAQLLADIFLFLRTNWFFLRRAGLERFERRQIYKYQSQNIKLLSYIFIFKTLIVIQLPD